MAEGQKRGLTELESLKQLEQMPLWRKVWVLLKLSEPGYLQSAFTLGSGTASACVLAGSKYGYQLLWVHPLAIVMGAIMLSALAKQTLTTLERPYKSFLSPTAPSDGALLGDGSIRWNQYGLPLPIFAAQTPVG